MLVGWLVCGSHDCLITITRPVVCCLRHLTGGVLTLADFGDDFVQLPCPGGPIVQLTSLGGEDAGSTPARRVFPFFIKMSSFRREGLRTYLSSNKQIESARLAEFVRRWL